MDILICGGLALLETIASASLLGDSVIGQHATRTVLVLFTVQYLAVKYYRIFLYHKYFSPFRDLPGPKDNHWFFGQAINLLKADSPTALYIKWMKENPEAPLIRYLTFANDEVLVCNNIECHKELLQTKCYSFSKPERWIRTFKALVGLGVLSMEGEAHRAARKLLAGPFSLGNIRKLEPVFQEKARDVGDLFDRAIAAGTDNKTGVINCTEVFSKATLDIIGVTTLGIDLANITSITFSDSWPASKKRWSGNEGGEYSFHDAYCITFGQNKLGKFLLYANGFFPTRWIPVQENRDFLFAADWLAKTLTQIIRDRKRRVGEAMAAGKYAQSESRDILTYIIEEHLSGGLANEATEEELLGHLMQLMSAGHDTSANVLSWGLYIMATRQEIQAKLRAEIEDLVAKFPEPDFTEIDKLSYLDNFIKETLRVYPPATTIHRQALEDLTLQGVPIAKGTNFDIVSSVTSLNPKIWGEDVDEVDPDRWDRLSGDQLSPYAFEVFSNGPRICVGRQFAYMEIKTIFVEIIRNYRFLSVEKSFTVENPAFTLRPNGLEVRLEKIA